MSHILSLLDKSPIPDGATPEEALANTVALAIAAEKHGYHRFWVAEHHASATLAGAAPEIVVAHVLARTSRIRVGSGGVMLQHYSPFKVAEVFRVLSALAPGRVDLGVGKAPGGLPFATRALQDRYDAARGDFEDLLADLDGFLRDTLPEGHRSTGAVATPRPAIGPEKVLLGASPASAETAARLGWGFSYAGHFDGDPEGIERSIEIYRRATGEVPSLALYAFAAPTRAEAERLVGRLRIFRVHLPDGRRVNLPSPEAAAEFARQAGVSNWRLEEMRPHVVSGTAEDVHAELDRLAARFGIREFVIDMPVPDFAARLASVELVAKARNSRNAGKQLEVVP